MIGEGPCPSVTGATMPVIDPATDREITAVAAGSAGDVDRAVEEARQAFEDGRWRRLAAFEKERRLRRLYDLVGEHAALLAELDVIDLGVPKMFADWMVAIALECIGYYAGWPSKLDGTVHPSTDIVRDRQIGILMVEHDMSLVLNICEWIYVLDFGKPLMDGPAADVRDSAEVRAAYLGQQSVGV